jgi:hypothetical protein
MLGIEGNAFAAIALLGYIPFAFLLFAFLPPRKAVIYDFLVAWLFLPMSHLPLHGFTDLNKMSAACVGTLTAAFIFDSPTIFAFRPKIWDIPMFIWCLCPFISSMGNSLGVYDGLSAVAYQTTSWGLPYFIGRIYFNDLVSMRELAIAIVVGGLIYVPLCWFEIRMSPQLHVWIYGYHQHDFSQTERGTSYRPMVFMEHGLAVAMWMGTSALTAFWLWRAKAVNKIFGMTLGWITLILVGTTLCLHSLGAQSLMLIGLLFLSLTSYTKSRVWILLLTLIPPTWMTVRTLNLWDGKNVVEFLQQHDKRAAESMRVRFHSERVLSAKAMKQPIYGWTAWLFFTQQEVRTQRGVPDQLWIIAFGHNGLIGLSSVTIALLLPIWLLANRIPVQYWKTAAAAPPAALAMLLTLHMCDNLFNAMVNPIFIICAGGLTGLSFTFASSTQFARRPQHRPQQTSALPFGSTATPA